ncbi:midnolin-A [Xenentodon cancila]
MRLSVTSTTGIPVELTVPRGETAEGLRTRISQKLRLQTDRIVLLHKDRPLTAGKLFEQGVTDGSKLTLVPVVEAGFICTTARERTVMDMLERLTEVQINDFLSGRSPLTLNIGAGSHTMYVELQLSAQNVKELHQDKDLKAQSSCNPKSDLHTSSSLSHPDSPSSWSSTEPSTSQTSYPALNLTGSKSSIQCSTQRPRISFNSPTSVPKASCHGPVSPDCSCLAHSSPSPSGFPHSSCPLQATTPVCSAGPTGSSPGPLSPASASTFSEGDVDAELSKQPGAVIETLVSHSPGVFSGTFSGTLAPCTHSDIGHPRRGIAIILQILNDLLRAAYYNQEGAPTYPLLQRCRPSNLPVSQLSTEEPCKARSKPPLTHRAEHMGDDSQLLPSYKDENKTLHCKLERLQLLMHQRRLRRRTRRSSHLRQTFCLHQHRHHRS